MSLAKMSSPNDSSTIEWLLASDPSIRWQTMRDLQDIPSSEWGPERQKVETSGWGAQLLSHQDTDGQWAGGAFVPRGFTATEWKAEGQPLTATCYALTQLHEFGLDPTSDRAKRTVELVGKNSRWDEGNQLFWEGETEECINGRTVSDGSYFGADVWPIVERLLGERQADGGWNCNRADGSVRSSFHSTINVLEGLLEYERAMRASGRMVPESVVVARESGQEYLLKRQLFRRLTTGEPADEQFLRFVHPNAWQYDVLRALDYFRSAALLTGDKPDLRLTEAIEHLRARRLPDGKWALDRKMPGRVWFEVNEGVDKPSPWITLRAMRVLKWWTDNQPQ